jgi:predicted Fe-Mo cluster-binding NifX family protein
MKLAICSRGQGLKAEVDERFGRCPYFVLVDMESREVLESIENSNVGASGGAGPQAAQLLSRHGVEVVALGNVGPNAVAALEAAGIAAYSGINGTVEATIQKYAEGSLTKVAGPTVESHSGMKK